MRPLTRSCFLLLVLGRLFLHALPFLLGICLRSLWSPPFPFHALALIPLFLAKVRLSPTLTLFPIMIWCFEQTALFLFHLVRAAPAFLPIALSVALRSLFPFWQAQYVQVFPLKPAPFCMLLVVSAAPTSLPFLFSSSSPIGLSFCPRHPALSSIFPHVLSDYNGSPDTRFSRGTTRLMSWPDGERYLRPPQSLAVSLFLPLVSTLVFSGTGGVLSYRNSLTHRFPRFPPRNLCSLLMLAVFSLVFPATDTSFC